MQTTDDLRIAQIINKLKKAGSTEKELCSRLPLLLPAGDYLALVDLICEKLIEEKASKNRP